MGFLGRRRGRRRDEPVVSRVNRDEEPLARRQTPADITRGGVDNTTVNAALAASVAGQPGSGHDRNDDRHESEGHGQESDTIPHGTTDDHAGHDPGPSQTDSSPMPDPSPPPTDVGPSISDSSGAIDSGSGGIF